MKPTKKPMMAKRTTKAAPAKKKMMASAKKPMTVKGKKVQKYQVGGMAAPTRITANTPTQRSVATPGGPSATMPPSNPRVVRPRPPQTGGVNPRPAAPGVGYGGIGRPGVQGRPMMPPSRINIPGITPPMNRPVRTPPQQQGIPQGMDPAMQQYAQMMLQRQGMQQFERPQPSTQQQMQAMPQGMNPAMQLYAQQYGQMPQPIQQMPSTNQLGQGGQMQGLGAAQGMNPDAQPQVFTFPGTPPEMRQQFIQALQQQPQQRGTLTAADEQMFPGISNASNQAPARFRKGGEAKKKAPAQGRMAKPGRRKK